MNNIISLIMVLFIQANSPSPDVKGGNSVPLLAQPAITADNSISLLAQPAITADNSISLLAQPAITAANSLPLIAPQVITADNFIYPVDPLTHEVSGYHFEIVYDDDGNFDHIHPGEDWNRTGVGGDGDRGDAVYAIGNGVVTYAGETNVGYGNVVLIEHTLPDGKMIWSQYAHLDSVDVIKGQVVLMGKQIGTIGNSGGVIFSHLHFEIRNKDLPADYWKLDNWDWVKTEYLDPDAFLVNYVKNSQVSNQNILAFSGR